MGGGEGMKLSVFIICLDFRMNQFLIIFVVEKILSGDKKGAEGLLLMRSCVEGMECIGRCAELGFGGHRS